MRTYVYPLFNECHLKVNISSLGKLHEMNGTSEIRRSTPHKKDIKFNLFSSTSHGLFTCLVFDLGF